MGLLYSFTSATKSGGGQLPFLSEPPAASSTGVAWPTANAAVFARVRVGAPLRVTRMHTFIGAASGNVDLGLYRSDDGGTTLTRIASTGSTAASGTNAEQVIALTAAVTLVPGIDYYLAMAADNATVTVARQTISSGMAVLGNHYVGKASSFPLPTTVSSLGGLTGAYVPFMGAD